MRIDTDHEIGMAEVQPAEKDAHRSGLTPESPKRRLGWGFFLLLIVILGSLAWFAKKGITTRQTAETTLATDTKKDAVPAVTVTYAKVSGTMQELVLPGNTQPLSDAPIFARTDGYLKKWYFDIGAHVKQGQVLAEIETPEVDQQLQQARAELDTAQANLSLSTITAKRYVTLGADGAVAKQDTDNAVGDMNAKKATVESAAANVKRLEQLQSFEKVVAPFDGVVTVRNTDVGQLVNSGSGANGKELFHMSATNKLRVFVSVPEEYERVRHEWN